MSTQTIPITLDLAATLSGNIVADNDPRLVNAPRVVPTIAALRELTPPVENQDSGYVIVEGYLTPGDGGGGAYVWKPLAVGQITGLEARTIYHIGAGYEAGTPTITVSAPPAGGRQAVITCQVQATYVQWHSEQPTYTLKAFTIVDPGEGYTTRPTITISPAPAGAYAFPCELRALGDFEDGGYTLASSVPDALGKWIAVDVTPGEVDLRRFGWVLDNVNEADNNALRFKCAFEALPPFYEGAYEGVLFGVSWLDEDLINRKGIVRMPDGNAYIGNPLVMTPYTSLVTGSNYSMLTAKPYFAPDPTQRKIMLRLAVNSEYGAARYPSPPNFSTNVTYSFTLNGYLRINGDYNSYNAGVLGCDFQGAQGCAINGELEVGGCSSGGMKTNLDATRLTALGGKNPMIWFYGSVGNRVGHIDVEHGEADPTPALATDADGDPHRFIRFEYASGVQVDYLSCEAFDPQNLAVINGAGIHIKVVGQNTMDSLFLVKNSSTLQVDSFFNVGAVNAGNDAFGQPILWIDNRVTGEKLPPNTPSYVPYFNAKTVTAGTSLTVGGNPVGATQVFDQQSATGRFKLRVAYHAVGAYLEQTTPFLVYMSDVGGQETTFLVQFVKTYGSPYGTGYPTRPIIQILSGPGIAFSIAGAGDYNEPDPATNSNGENIVADFAFPAASGTFSSIRVIRLGADDGYNMYHPVWSTVSDTTTTATTPLTHYPVLTINGDGSQLQNIQASRLPYVTGTPPDGTAPGQLYTDSYHAYCWLRTNSGPYTWRLIDDPLPA